MRSTFPTGSAAKSVAGALVATADGSQSFTVRAASPGSTTIMVKMCTAFTHSCDAHGPALAIGNPSLDHRPASAASERITGAQKGLAG